MLSKTRAIVLRSTKYAENSLVVKLYTENFGLKSYLIGGVHGKKSKAAFFLPLSLLEIVAHHTEKDKLIKPKEINSLESLQQIQNDFQKQAILLFLNEVIYKSIKEEEANPNMFTFILEHILELNNTHASIANFHLNFLIEFSRLLGFYPLGKCTTATPYFNLEDGIFETETNNYSLDKLNSSLLYTCMNGSFEGLSNKQARNNLLEKMLLFYSFHIHGFANIKSYEILKEING